MAIARQTGNTFKADFIVVAEEKPNYDMILMGADPALGMAMFRREHANYAEVWRDLANQVEQKGLRRASPASFSLSQ